MHGRGNSKRHTLALGSAEEVQEAQRKMQQQQPQQQQPMRTRRTGLHTVMERPPGKHLCLSAVYSFIVSVVFVVIVMNIISCFVSSIIPSSTGMKQCDAGQ
jgi:hypothetical protein